MILRAKYLVTFAVLAALFAGAFAPGGACLRAVFGAGHVTSRQVAKAGEAGNAPGPSQIPACFSDARVLTASVSERSGGIHHTTPVLYESQVRPLAAPFAVNMPPVSGLPQSFPLFLSSSVLRI